MYTNLDGIKGKTKSLEQTATSLNAHIVAVAETKQKPAKLLGYGSWISKERKHKGGGGVAICAKQEYCNKLTKNENLGEGDQEVLWTEFRNTQKEITNIAIYYGKQEKEKRETIQKEFKDLTTQTLQAKQKGEVIMNGDFNAKLEINTPQIKQSTSPNGIIMNENLIKKAKLIPITMTEENAKWTRQHRKNQNEKSIIDYILLTEKLAQNVTEIMVDEEGTYRIKGKSNTDHNTILVEVNMNIEQQTEKVARWNLNNKEGWKKYNELIKTRVKEKDPINQKELNEIIIDSLKDSIGLTIVTMGKKTRKTTKEENRLRIKKKIANKEYREALKTNREKVSEKLIAYQNAQKNLREQIERQ